MLVAAWPLTGVRDAPGAALRPAWSSPSMAPVACSQEC